MIKNNTERKKIKVAMVTNHLEITGIGTVILNYCKALNKSKFDITIIAGRPISELYKKECAEYGIKLISLPSRHKETTSHYLKLWKVLKREKFDIVHVHGSSSMMAMELTIAKLVGVKKRIAHSHNSNCPNIKIHKILNPYFNKTYTVALACSKSAGDWIFNKNNFEILPNGFDTEKFVFSKSDREILRKELDVENKFIIGHIGRMNGQKNQEYLLKIFEKIAQKREDTILLMVGTGPDKDKIKNLVEMHPYKNRIILYGETNNPEKFYSVMDLFVFPSKYEGLPVVLLEAQISGLPCVVSDRVTSEVDFGNINWQSINENPNLWADVCLRMEVRTDEERRIYKKKYSSMIEKYNIEYAVNKLENLYECLMGKQV